MATKTDPARDIADFCKRLAKPVKGPPIAGDKHLAQTFEVKAWSHAFFQILSSFMERTDFLITIIPELGLDDDQQTEIRDHIRKLQRICGREILIKRWDDSQGGLRLVTSPHVAAVGALSSAVRQRVAYPKLDPTEVAEIIELVDQLLAWLDEQQLRDHDFIRYALIQGLRLFRFRLSHIGWLGWNCALDALREVVSAYWALERGVPELEQNPNAAAVLKHTYEFLKKVWETTGLATEVKGRVDVAIQCYGWYAVVKDSGIAGLLTAGNS